MIRAALAVSLSLSAVGLTAAMSGGADDAATCQSLGPTPQTKIEVCTRAIEANTARQYTLAMLYFSRSVAYEALRDLDRAMADLDAAIRVRPNELFYRKRAGWHEDRGEYPAALDDLKAAMGVSSTPYMVLGARIHLYRKIGDFDHALADCDELIAHTPKSAAHRILRGDVYRQNGDLNSAIADYREALKLEPNNRTAAQRLIETERSRT